jgi:hypothetical protein
MICKMKLWPEFDKATIISPDEHNAHLTAAVTVCGTPFMLSMAFDYELWQSLPQCHEQAREVLRKKCWREAIDRGFRINKITRIHLTKK